MNNTYNWEVFPKTKIYQNILLKWKNLLDDRNLKEQDYHFFLQKYPAIFLTAIECYFVISKLKLGSEYETDFVLVNEGYSNGTEYELIEIESPHTELFDKSGKPTAKFNSALQQIRDWKRFLIHNKGEFKKTFPTVNTKIIRDSKLKFKIIIGRRTDNQEHIDKRRQIEESENVEIISFDRLTDLAGHRLKFSNEPLIFASQLESKSEHLRNRLANPFYECTKDSIWRRICKKGPSHFYSNMLNEILEVRSYNESMYEFIDWLEANEY